MNKELKKEIINYIFDNLKDFQLINNTTKHFREYIYNTHGDYLIGGDKVHNFIKEAVDLIEKN